MLMLLQDVCAQILVYNFSKGDECSEATCVHGECYNGECKCDVGYLAESSYVTDDNQTIHCIDCVVCSVGTYTLHTHRGSGRVLWVERYVHGMPRLFEYHERRLLWTRELYCNREVRVSG